MKRAYIPFPLALLAATLCLGWAANLAAADLPPNLAQSLVLYYNFDAAPTNGVIADQSGRHNNGHVTGAQWLASGRQGGAMTFAATNDFITVTNNDSLNLEKMTIAVWFKTAKSDVVARQIVEKRATRGYALGIAGDSKNTHTQGKLVFTINGRYFCRSDNVLTYGDWHHAAALFDGKEMNLYVDGSLQKQTKPCPGALAANPDNLTIGMNRTNPEGLEKNHSFDGALDELMIFNRALTSDEIRSLISAADQTGGKFKFTKQQVAGRLRQLKLLYEEGLLTEKFYNAKVAECEAAQ